MSLEVKLEECGFVFPDGTVGLHPLTLDFPPGSVTALLGPSGCGKTTTLRILAGLAQPAPGGRVLFDEVDVTRTPVEKRGIGMVFQNYALFPNRDVAGNIAYGLEVRGVRAEARRARVTEMLRLTRMEGLALRRVDQLSGGQRQRVALARALAPAPKLLLLDEPFGALDARLRETLRIELAGLLAGLGITAVFVTHDQAEAMGLGDRVVVMNAGRVEQVGTPQEVYARPRTRFVGRFLGTLNHLGGDEFCRPEAMWLAPEGAVSARVKATFFEGGRTRVQLKPELTGVIEDWLMETTGAAPAVGEAVNVAIDAEKVLVLER